MAGYGGKGGGDYGAAGNPGGGYPLALAGGSSRPFYSNGGNSLQTLQPNAIAPYSQGMGQGMQPYSGGKGKGYDGMNIAVIVQTTQGTYSFFVGADGSAGMAVPGASFMYMPNSALQGRNSLDGLVGSGYNANKKGGDRLGGGYNSGKMGGLENQMFGPGMGGYDPLKNQKPDLKDFGEADYKMRDPNYASNRLPEKKEDYMNNTSSQKGLMRQEPKARYDEMGRQAKEGTTDNYGYSSAGRAQQKKDKNNPEPQLREPSQLERVAMGIPIDSYQALPLGT